MNPFIDSVENEKEETFKDEYNITKLKATTEVPRALIDKIDKIETHPCTKNIKDFNLNSTKQIIIDNIELVDKCLRHKKCTLNYCKKIKKNTNCV